MNDDVHPFRSPSARGAYLSQYDKQAEKWPIPAETRLVGTSYGDTFVRIGGPKGAPPLVLIPGRRRDLLGLVLRRKSALSQL